MELAALVLLLAQETPPRAALHPGPVQASTESPAVRVERDVLVRVLEFGERREELRLDAYLPAGDEPHPAVLLVYGGAWMYGDKRDMREFGELLAREGYACFAPRYRLAPTYRYPAQLEDCRYALQFVRSEAARFHVDPQRFGALGLSAGGHLAALLGVLDEARDPAATDPVLRQSSRVQCVVDFFGPVLLSRTPEFDFDTQPPPELFGDAPDSAYAAASPLRFVTSDDASFLLIHGDVDKLVPVGHALAMDEALRAVGVHSELELIAGGGHGDFLLRDPGGVYWKHALRFLAAELRADVAATPAASPR